jgi:hypothetical protein
MRSRAGGRARRRLRLRCHALVTCPADSDAPSTARTAGLAGTAIATATPASDTAVPTSWAMSGVLAS